MNTQVPKSTESVYKCEYCEEPFEPNPQNHNPQNIQRFCTKSCRWKQWDMENARMRKGRKENAKAKK